MSAAVAKSPALTLQSFQDLPLQSEQRRVVETRVVSHVEYEPQIVSVRKVSERILTSEDYGAPRRQGSFLVSSTNSQPIQQGSFIMSPTHSQTVRQGSLLLPSMSPPHSQAIRQGSVVYAQPMHEATHHLHAQSSLLTSRNATPRSARLHPSRPVYSSVPQGCVIASPPTVIASPPMGMSPRHHPIITQLSQPQRMTSNMTTTMNNISQIPTYGPPPVRNMFTQSPPLRKVSVTTFPTTPSNPSTPYTKIFPRSLANASSGINTRSSIHYATSGIEGRSSVECTTSGSRLVSRPVTTRPHSHKLKNRCC